MDSDTTATIKKALSECTGLPEIPLTDGGDHADLATTVAFALATVGMGMFIAWMANMPAASTAMRGTFSSSSAFRAHFSEKAMNISAMIQ